MESLLYTGMLQEIYESFRWPTLVEGYHHGADTFGEDLAGTDAVCLPLQTRSFQCPMQLVWTRRNRATTHLGDPLCASVRAALPLTEPLHMSAPFMQHVTMYA